MNIGSTVETTSTSRVDVSSGGLSPNTTYKLMFAAFVGGAYDTTCELTEFTTTA